MESKFKRIGFYLKESGNYTSFPKDGITKDQIAFLHSLKEGERLIIYIEKNKKHESSPDATLKKLEKKKL